MTRPRMSIEQLTHAAARLADEIGFDNLTVAALARSLEVRDANLYSHLKNGDDLRIRVAVLALTELADRASDALAGRAGTDALVAFAAAYRDYATTHPGRYAATRIPLSLETATAAQRHADLTRAILRGYALPEPAETDAVRLLHSTFHGFVSLERTGAFARQSRTADESWASTLDGLDLLLRNWPGV
ncbi:TetR/AcrR family transcriptional regulator [Nocardia sp. NPDC051570]|uniref:TetR/AcrR family transcriptional regulator n=1 Tax=Nocardia sp. NPDC051570 TaxID=3364324 RepID=UPI003793CB6B